MASDLPKVTSLVCKQARTGPRQLDSRVSFWTIMASGLMGSVWGW